MDINSLQHSFRNNTYCTDFYMVVISVNIFPCILFFPLNIISHAHFLDIIHIVSADKSIALQVYAIEDVYTFVIHSNGLGAILCTKNTIINNK